MTSEGMKAMQQISAALEVMRELSDAELIIQYRAWQAEYEALEALERSWKRSETDRHSDLWSLIFEGAHDALPAAFREIDRLQKIIEGVNSEQTGSTQAEGREQTAPEDTA